MAFMTIPPPLGNNGTLACYRTTWDSFLTKKLPLGWWACQLAKRFCQCILLLVEQGIKHTFTGIDYRINCSGWRGNNLSTNGWRVQTGWGFGEFSFLPKTHQDFHSFISPVGWKPCTAGRWTCSFLPEKEILDLKSLLFLDAYYSIF